MLIGGLLNLLLWCLGSLLVITAFLVISVLFCAVVINPRTGAKQQCDSVSSPVSLTVAMKLKVVTFNIADAYLFTTNRRERMRAIGKLLTQLDPDIVGLQEAFIRKDREILFEALAESRLRHHAVYPAGTVGNGLLTLSAYPIVDSCFHRFRNTNPWHKLHQGDWWAGKGVGFARIQLPDGSMVDFYNTHLQAQRRDPANAIVRAKQIGELTAFARETRLPAATAFIVGDFNGKITAPDIRSLIDDEGFFLLMRLPSRIDFIFGIPAANGALELLDTIEVAGTTHGNRPAILLSRAPTPREYWRMRFGAPEITPLSDHLGYLSSVRIGPASSP